MKACTKCGVEKDDADFPHNGYTTGGRPRLRSSCKECEKHRIPRQEATRICREWRARNRDKVSEANKRAYRRGKGDVVATPLPKPPVDGNIQLRKYREENRAKLRDYRRSYEARTRDHRKEKRKARHIERPSVRLSAMARRSAKEWGAEGNFTAADADALFEKQRGLCANPRCATALVHGNISIDHIVPFSRGGTNWPDNIQWLCLSCNKQKHARTMVEWLGEAV